MLTIYDKSVLFDDFKATNYLKNKPLFGLHIEKNSIFIVENPTNDQVIFRRNELDKNDIMVKLDENAKAGIYQRKSTLDFQNNSSKISFVFLIDNADSSFDIEVQNVWHGSDRETSKMHFTAENQYFFDGDTRINISKVIKTVYNLLLEILQKEEVK